MQTCVRKRANMRMQIHLNIGCLHGDTYACTHLHAMRHADYMFVAEAFKQANERMYATQAVKVGIWQPSRLLMLPAHCLLVAPCVCVCVLP